jgi:hypothetical protein
METAFPSLPTKPKRMTQNLETLNYLISHFFSFFAIYYQYSWAVLRQLLEGGAEGHRQAFHHPEEGEGSGEGGEGWGGGEL